MKRREFITLLGGAAATWPHVAHAQKLPTVGFLGQTTRPAASEWVIAFAQRLRELGWIEGRTIAIEYRWAEGRNERLAEIAAEFVRLKVNIIVTSGTPQVAAAMHATSVIPIVFATAGDPVGSGLVASLARPGGNVTGLATLGADLAGKRLELLREVLPGLGRLAVMGNVGNPFTVLELDQVQAAARGLGLQAFALEIRRAEDIAPAIDASKGRADALYVCTDALANANRIRINILAVGARLSTMHGSRDYVEAGGLMSYGPNFPDLFRRAADFVDKILRGVKPSDIPVELPTKFDLVVNLFTARALDRISRVQGRIQVTDKHLLASRLVRGSRISLSDACCTRCSNRRPSESTLDRRWHWPPDWLCIGQDRCACGLCRRIRSSTSATQPTGKLRCPPPSAPRVLRLAVAQQLWEQGQVLRPAVAQQLWEQRRVQRWRRIGSCGTHSMSVRQGCPRFLPPGTWRCIPSRSGLPPMT